MKGASPVPGTMRVYFMVKPEGKTAKSKKSKKFFDTNICFFFPFSTPAFVVQNFLNSFVK
jgi:hypothetical protein